VITALATAVASAVVVSGCGSASSGAGPRTTPTPARLALRPCRVSGVDEEAHCGAHEVYEDRGARQGRVIGLNVVVLPARNGRSLDPVFVFVLQGGPGQAATSLPDFYARTFAALRGERVVVLVDQRGTGKSNPQPARRRPQRQPLVRRARRVRRPHHRRLRPRRVRVIARRRLRRARRAPSLRRRAVVARPVSGE
jgi:hypothetical protein